MVRPPTEQGYSQAEALCDQTIKDLPNSLQGCIIQVSWPNRLASIHEAQSRYQEALTAVHSASRGDNKAQT
ncbi:MAG: hypothetical protein F6J90_34760 [Moorea sp. SIOASIH]|uniref:hypothetical protein n=1 Tax=Moorena sp. SIOASIH TaxID=2607817 RepID=UPI0013B5F7C2|nr:hypothetical protein [Moorena sp. SIOASIH]NEO41212.1 hypothetical protein [Moorena sp. SIOASIH]